MDLLRAGIRHYDWGDPSFLARLQGRAPSGRPEAELWMGSHPGAPSRLARDDRRLDDVIAADPVAALGDDVAQRFGRLPFLAKILAAAQPLSVQAHPSTAQAQEGFACEEAAGVPVDAPDRIYRDDRHKPEIICALTRFEARCGFRELAGSRELVAGLAAHGGRRVAEVAARLGDEGDDADVLAAVVSWLLRLDPDDADGLVAEVVDAAATIADGPFARECQWVTPMAAHHPGDPGVVVAMLLNHVDLAPGQAVFLEAGNLHSYLHGAGVELMSNSDNVVRGGLTTKHVDVDELLRVVDCTPVAAAVQTAAGDDHRFVCPVPDFSLRRLVVDDRVVADPDGPEIVVVTGGEVQLTRPGDEAGAGPCTLRAGTSAWVPAAGGAFTIDGAGEVYRCGVGPA